MNKNNSIGSVVKSNLVIVLLGSLLVIFIQLFLYTSLVYLGTSFSSICYDDYFLCLFVPVKIYDNTDLDKKQIFYIGQHSRDSELMTSLESYLGCGTLKIYTNKYFCGEASEAREFIVTKFSDITKKIVQFLVLYPLHGSKSKYFSDLWKVSDLIANKGHLTKEVLAQIQEIKAGMNTLRRW